MWQNLYRSSGEEAGGGAPEASAPAETTPPPAPAPDKYAGLNPDQREAAMEADRQIESLGPTGRAELVRLAYLALEQEKAKANAPKEEKPKAEEDKLTKVERELESLKAEKKREQEMAEAKAKEQAFWSNVDKVLDEKGKDLDPETREDIREQMLARQLLKRPSDIRAEVEKRIEREVAKLGNAAERGKKEGSRGYVQSKIDDFRQTRGEASGGSSPSKTEKKFTGKDFNHPRDEGGFWSKFEEYVSNGVDA